MSDLVPIIDPIMDLSGTHLDLSLYYLWTWSSWPRDLVNLGLRSGHPGPQISGLLGSPFNLRSHQTPQYQILMVGIDWIASDSPLKGYVRGRVQHTA